MKKVKLINRKNLKKTEKIDKRGVLIGKKRDDIKSI